MNNTKNYTGLSASQVVESRRLHGRNILTPPEKESLLKRFLQTLTGPFGHLIKGWEDGDMLVFILEMAALLSIGISLSEYNGWLGLPVSPDGAKVFFEPAGIIIAIILASGVGFIAEVKAEREFEVLNQVNDDEPVTVIRNLPLSPSQGDGTSVGKGQAMQIPRQDVVVGDIIVLSTGEEIPADATLLEATQLSVDESSLTGEPMTRKTTPHNEPSTFVTPSSGKGQGVGVVGGDGDTYPSYNVYRGTKVMEGHAIAEVFAVGDSTENGKVFTAAKIDDGKKTPLNEQFDRLGILITTISCIVGVLVFIGRIVIYLHTHDFPSGNEWGEAIAYTLQSIMIAVTLVVCAVPEGLPMAVTMSLAYSMRRMLKTNNLVRKMHACETMGATTVICTDKTGTLTMNQMRVAETLLAEEHRDLIYKNMAINSTAMLNLPQPQSSLYPLQFPRFPGDRNPRRGEQSCTNKSPNIAEAQQRTGQDAEVIGNPTEGALLLWLHDQGIDYNELRSKAVKTSEEPFSTETKYMSTTLADGTILYKGAPEVIMSMCNAFAISKEKAEETLRDYQHKAMRTLAFAVKTPYITPPSGEGKGEEVTFLGIVGIMDPVRPDVPPAIQECLRAGIKVKIVTGDAPETAKEIYRQIFGTEPQHVVLGSATAEELASADIIARAKPMNKKLLVETLQQQGEVVAVTGDGTNDAPALKSAHVGLSMGDGTSVAKEASDITIIDNSFSSICKAVMWGRSLYINIQRFILFQLTVNITACLVVMIGSFMTPDPPLTVTQMLWVNLIMDTFAAVALASLPPSEAVMNSKPRDRKTNIIDRQMAIDLLGTGFFFTVLLLLLLSVFGSMNGTEKGVFFTFFILLQFWNLFAAKKFKATSKWSLSNLICCNVKGEKAFWFIAFVIFFGQMFIVSIAYNFFNIEPVDATLTCLTILFTMAAVAIKRLIIWLVSPK